MKYEPENEREKEFFSSMNAKYLRAINSESRTVYSYGLGSVVEKAKRFFAEKKHEILPCSRYHEVNPYYYQYDMEVEMFLNYDKIVKDEIEFLDNLLSKEGGDKDRRREIEFKIEMVDKYGTGIPREEHFWNACSIRWPIRKIGKAEHGPFVREPWAEDFINGLCSHDYVITFGGSGQGKTHRALAFMCVGWDHYIESYEGGRGIFSTVAESKLRGSTWPYLQRIYKETVGGRYDKEERKQISLYAGRGIIMSDYTIVRPDDTKGGGTLSGLLISNRVDNSAVDKITGSHGHPFGMYHIDELQSTPDAPIKASPNFKQNCKHSWITAAGNYDLDTDSLGKNTVPMEGWANVDEETHIYESINSLGIRTLCIHYNNEHSPAITKKGEEKWGHILPTQKKRDSVYQTAASKHSDEYRRFWIGWKKKRDISDSVLSTVMIKSSSCNTDTEFDPSSPIYHGWSFDSAPSSTDRNILTHFIEGMSKRTSLWTVQVVESIALPKSEDRLKYVRQTGDLILSYSSKWNVKSGRGIMDWTNITGIPEYLRDRGFNVVTISYNEAVPDGVRKNPRTGEVEDAILVDKDSGKFGHEVVTNLISLGAYAIQQLVFHGQITGLKDELVNDLNSSRSFEEEICKRAFLKVPSAKFGELQQLEPKSTKGRKSSDRGIKGFKEMYGFSPDILDTIFQIGYYMVKVRRMIIGDRKSKNNVVIRKQGSDIKREDKQEIKHSNIWVDDLLEVG